MQCRFHAYLTSIAPGKGSVEESASLGVVSETVVDVSRGLETTLDGVDGDRVAKVVLIGVGSAGDLEITDKTEVVDRAGLPEVVGMGVGETVATEAMGEVEEGSSSMAVEKELGKPMEVVEEGAMVACSETVIETL